MSDVDAARLKVRLAVVEEHVHAENRRDLAALMATFGAEARYDDEPWQDRRLGFEGAQDRIAGERIYYDRGTVMRQLGLFHEPDSGLGRVITALSHPLTIARAFLQSSGGQ